MPSIPSHHVVGDTGHTTDHNSIVDVLTDHEARLVSQAASISGSVVKAGSNIINVANPSGWYERVDIPAGTRDASVWVEQVTYGGKRTFGLDTYGQIRIDAATTSQVGLVVSGYSSSHATDIMRWRQYEGGTTLGRIDQNGNIYAPNITPGAWTNLTLASGIAWKGNASARPQYRVVGDRVELRGAIKKSDGTDFSTSPTTIATMPVGTTPPYLTYLIQACELGSGMASVRLEITTAGVMKFYLITPSSTPQTPAWMTLDGGWWSLTA